MSLIIVCKSIIIGIPIGITFIDFVGYIARVDGRSMQPTLNPADRSIDYVFLNRWKARDYAINRGDVIALISPKNPNQKIIKRVIGVEGDVIKTLSFKRTVVKVPQGHCWVEGDCTKYSMDSNSFGPVSLGLITAKASAIVWPPSRWQKVNSCLPENRLPLNIVRK